MKILPGVCALVPFVLNDGMSFEEVPFQVIGMQSGATYIRIGHNVFVFGPDGKFTGTEHNWTDATNIAAIAAAVERSEELKGVPPGEPYFSPDSPGYAAETAGWHPGVKH